MTRFSSSPGVREWLGRHWPEVAALVATLILTISLVSTGVLSTATPDDTNNLILALVGAGAFPFAVWRSRSGQRQADATRAQAEAAQREATAATDQARAATLARLNDQFTAAANMLMHDAVYVRRLGIQSFEQLATVDPAEYYVRVLRSLCDYAREPYLRTGEEPYAVDQTGRLRSDVQAAVQGIGRVWRNEGARRIARKRPDDKGYVPNLIEANLSGGRIWSLSLEDAHLKRAVCRGTAFGDVDLKGVDLTGADLSGADFTGELIDDRGSVQPVRGLTQQQLDQAVADPDRPPRLDGVLDAETEGQLVWRGRPLDSDSA